ncbi:hypothetical protein ERIC1_2c00060 [Paenibacillus larvae subsp. larvae DSM 25719]|uniref:UPF0489 family protein n=1 Tax=Paenibacillus larvae TaxID=1464 RepID=UPI0003DC5183|nr:UPF0489 family protein [Paenibacillus larvae]ETK25818.1 hypothetical protein ERIC1_2c00060 [Paenibacillus larvae subsp. larvae DSM 25719]
MWEHGWKIYFPDSNIYVSTDHNWAFGAWELERMKGNLNQSLLLHVDSHLDDLVDGILIEGIFDIKTKEDIIVVTENHDSSKEKPKKYQMDIANFIWPAWARGTIEEAYYISRDKKDLTTTDTLKKNTGNMDAISIMKKISHRGEFFPCRVKTIEEFRKKAEKRFLLSANHRDTILDIDLDFFNSSDYLFNPDIMPEKEIRDILRYLKGLCQWNVVTIALSPLYCGGKEIAENIFKIFLDEFNLELEQSVMW